MLLLWILILFHVCNCQNICTISLSELAIISNANLLCAKLILTSSIEKGDLLRIIEDTDVLVESANQRQRIRLSNRTCEDNMIFQDIPGHLHSYVCGDYVDLESNENEVTFIDVVNNTVQAIDISWPRGTYAYKECILRSNLKETIPKIMIRDWKVENCPSSLSCDGNDCHRDQRRNIHHCKRSCASIMEGDGAVFIKYKTKPATGIERRQIIIAPNSIDFIARDFLFIQPWNSVCFRMEIIKHSKDVVGLILQDIKGGYLGIRNHNGVTLLKRIRPTKGKCQSFTGRFSTAVYYHICTQFDEQIYLPLKEVIIKGTIIARVLTQTQLTRGIDWIPFTSQITQSRSSSALFKETIFEGNETCSLTCNAAIEGRGKIICNETLYDMSRAEMFRQFHPVSSNLSLNVYDKDMPNIIYESNHHMSIGQESGVKKITLNCMLLFFIIECIL